MHHGHRFADPFFISKTKTGYLLSYTRYQNRCPVIIEMTGFEPAASASRTQRSTKLSHISLYSAAKQHRTACDLNIIPQTAPLVKRKFCNFGKIIRNHNLPLEISNRMWYNVYCQEYTVSVFGQIPDYRCAGPVQQSTVNHVRRGTEQH